jgi:hypothetical protein
MASELSGRVRCQKWHDTNHRKDILGSVYHRWGSGSELGWVSNPDPSPRRDVAVPLLIPFIGAETKPLLPTYLRPATGSGGRGQKRKLHSC